MAEGNSPHISSRGRIRPETRVSSEASPLPDSIPLSVVAVRVHPRDTDTGVKDGVLNRRKLPLALLAEAASDPAAYC